MLAKIISKTHLIIITYSLWSAWILWEEHALEVSQVRNEKPVIALKIKKLKTDRKRVRGYLKDIEKAKEKIKLVEEEVRILQRKLPEKIQDAANLETIKTIGKSVNIKNVFLAPSLEDNRGFYFAKKYDLTATGTYLQFLLLFEKIATAEQLFNVSDIELKRSNVKRRGRYQLVNAKISIEAYRYNSKANTIIDEEISGGDE